MKQYKSFRKYLIEHDSSFTEKIMETQTLLTEGLVGRANKEWPNFSLTDLITVSTFSDEWSSDSIMGHFSGKFPIDAIERLETFWNTPSSVMRKFKANKMWFKYQGMDKTKVKKIRTVM